MPDQQTGTPAGNLGTLILEDTSTATDKPWQAVLYNDDVNDAEHVAEVLQAVLNISIDAAHQLMLRAHMEGKAVVKDGSHEEILNIVHALQREMLTAKDEKA